VIEALVASINYGSRENLELIDPSYSAYIV
jgi:hypothetical protein